MSETATPEQHITQALVRHISEAPEHLLFEMERRVVLLEEFRTVCDRQGRTEAADAAEACIIRTIACWEALTHLLDTDSLLARLLKEAVSGA